MEYEQWKNCLRGKKFSGVDGCTVSRLVVFGNHQVEGEDHRETFPPMAKMTTFRCFLELVAASDWEVHQMDDAFLHGDLEEEVYMRFPLGFHVDDKNKVC